MKIILTNDLQTSEGKYTKGKIYDIKKKEFNRIGIFGDIAEMENQGLKTDDVKVKKLLFESYRSK
jgi:hypothetical protein